MKTINEKADVVQFDVILAEQDIACRCANADVLTRFGFQSSRIHGVEYVQQAVEKMKELEATYSQKPRAPVLVFLPPLGCPMFSEQKFRLQYFLVRVSESETQVTKASPNEGAWHCTIPNKLDENVVLACSDLAQEWWTAEFSKEQRMKEFHERAACKREARSAKEGQQKMSIPMLQPSSTVHSNGSSNKTPPTALAETLCTGPPKSTTNLDHQSPPRADTFGCSSTQSASSASSDRGNSLSSLALLLPAKSPFEDVHIIRHVGVGSFGRVYKARWDACVVALKVIHHKEADITRAAFEGALSASLAHPGLVQTFKYSIREGSDASNEVWIVQEFCALGTLSEAAKSQKLLNKGQFPQIAEVCCEIASAALYLHSRGTVHGDLSGNNVLLTVAHCSKGFVAKVCDFGMARVLGTTACINTLSMGTVSSSPPELFSDNPGLTTKVDVYAFGMLLYMLCSGKSPWEGLLAPQIVVRVALGKILALPSSVPQNLITLYNTCTDFEAANRPEFQKIISDLLDHGESCGQ